MTNDVAIRSDLEDLTPRARIRLAALELFAEHGYAGASIRDVAAAAGVSPGLVQHHFRTKAALREACDDYAVTRLRDTKAGTLRATNLASPSFLAEAYEHTLPAVRYLGRSLIEGTPVASRLYDEMVELIEAELESGETLDSMGDVTDRRALAAVVVAQNLGTLALNAHVSRALGADILTRQGHARVARTLLHLYSHPLVAPEFAAAGLEAFDRLDAMEQATSASQPDRMQDEPTGDPHD